MEDIAVLLTIGCGIATRLPISVGEASSRSKMDLVVSVSIKPFSSSLPVIKDRISSFESNCLLVMKQSRRKNRSIFVLEISDVLKNLCACALCAGVGAVVGYGKR